MAALTLVEAAKKNSGVTLRDAVVQIFAETSDVLGNLPFVGIPGASYTYVREETLPGIGFRGVNASYTPSTGILNPATDPLVIAGGEIDVDKFIVATHGEDQRQIHENMKIKALALSIAKAIIKGDNTSDNASFDGLQARLVGDQKQANGSTSGGDALSLYNFDKAVDQTDNPNGIIMNKTMLRRLSVAAKTSSVGGDLQWQVDDFGKRVAFYSGLPIWIADYDNLGAQILPFTEANPGGGTAASTSIYVVKFEAGYMQGIENGGIMVDDLGQIDSSPVFRTRIEWYLGMAALHPRAATRLWGITDAVVTA